MHAPAGAQRRRATRITCKGSIRSWQMTYRLLPSSQITSQGLNVPAYLPADTSEEDEESSGFCVSVMIQV